MNKLQKALGIGALALTSLLGCDNPETYLEGKVIKEGGSVVNIVQSSGALFGNDSVKFGDPTYVLAVETNEGKYIIDVREYSFTRTFKHTLVALAEAIKEGSVIKFPKSYKCNGKDESYFAKDKIGRLSSDSIEVVKE